MSAKSNPLARVASASDVLSRLGCAEIAADLAHAGEDIAELAAAMRYLLPRIQQTNGADCVDRAKAALLPFKVQPPPAAQPAEANPLANRTIYTTTQTGLAVAVAFDGAGRPQSVARKSAGSDVYKMFWCAGSDTPKGNTAKSAILAAIHAGSPQ